MKNGNGGDTIYEKSFPKSDTSEIKIQVIKKSNGDCHVDIREYVDTEGYSGPTKKGVRFYTGDELWQTFLDIIDEADEVLEEFL